MQTTKHGSNTDHRVPANDTSTAGYTEFYLVNSGKRVLGDMRN